MKNEDTNITPEGIAESALQAAIEGVTHVGESTADSVEDILDMSDFDSDSVERGGISKLRSRIMMYTQRLYKIYANLGISSLDELEQFVIDNIATNPDDLYAIVLHNKDRSSKDANLLANEHIHIAFAFKNPQYMERIAKLFKDYRADGSVNVQTMTRFKGNVNNLFSYLCHRTARAAKKYQYNPADVIANFDYVSKLNEITTNVAVAKAKANGNVKVMCELLRNLEITLTEAKSSLPAYNAAQSDKVLTQAFIDGLKAHVEEWRANKNKLGYKTKVYWIWGKAGTGKTRLAKDIASNITSNYYVTGSGKDTWERYLGNQHVAIIEECRPSMFYDYRELLTILDNYQNDTVVCSRYHDKELALDVIIVTTVFSPFEFYKNMVTHNRNIDTFYQLGRRISCCIHMNDDFITHVTFDCNTGLCAPDSHFIVHNPYSEKNHIEDIEIMSNDEFQTAIYSASAISDYYSARDEECMQYEEYEDCEESANDDYESVYDVSLEEALEQPESWVGVEDDCESELEDGDYDE